MDASSLLTALADRHGWTAEDKVDLICSFADLQDTFWTTPSLPGSRPPSFAQFLDDVEQAFSAVESSPSGTDSCPGALPPAPSDEAGLDPSEEEEDGPPPAEGVLLQKPAPVVADAPKIRDLTVALTLPQTKKAESLLGVDFDPDAEGAPEEGEVVVGPVIGPFPALDNAAPAEISVSVRVGRPVCFVQATLFVQGKVVRHLQPRYESLVGVYEFTHEKFIYRLTVVPPPARRSSK